MGYTTELRRDYALAFFRERGESVAVTESTGKGVGKEAAMRSCGLVTLIDIIPSSIPCWYSSKW